MSCYVEYCAISGILYCFYIAILLPQMKSILYSSLVRHVDGNRSDPVTLIKNTMTNLTYVFLFGFSHPGICCMK